MTDRLSHKPGKRFLKLGNANLHVSYVKATLLLEDRQHLLVLVEDPGLVLSAGSADVAVLDHVNDRQQGSGDLRDLDRCFQLTLAAAGADQQDLYFALVC